MLKVPLSSRPDLPNLKCDSSILPALFLNYGNNFIVMDYPITAYSYNDISGQSRFTIRRKREVNESFPILLDWIRIFIMDNGCMSNENIGRNRLIIQVRIIHNFSRKLTDS